VAAAKPEAKKLKREQKGLSRTPNLTGGKETNSSLDPAENKSSWRRKSETRRKWNRGPGAVETRRSGSLLRTEEETGEVLSGRTRTGTKNRRQTQKLLAHC
jgi:hypothetical protein